MSEKDIEQEKKGKGLVDGAVSSTSAYATETKTQWTKYPHKTGHGFAAEDANAINDEYMGKFVERVGGENVKDGADRISNGVSIQTKYYQKASGTVNSAFADNGNGNYRYEGQVLEVPKDQYSDAIALMKQKIEEGKVPHVKDPEKAHELIKEGSVTYVQAKNVAKAGNIDSIKFDVQTQVVAGAMSLGIGAIVSLAHSVWNGEDDLEAALKKAVFAGLRSGAITLTVGVATQQFLRMQLGRNFAAGVSGFSKQTIDALYKTSIGRPLIEKTVSALYGKTLHGAAATSAATKLLRTNLVTGTLTTLAVTLPDFSRMIGGTISPEQFTKNLVINASSVAGGMGGAALGSTLGTAILPGAGTFVGALVGGFAGALSAGKASKAIADEFCEDDVVHMSKILCAELPSLGEEYLTTEKEFNKKIEPKVKEKISAAWFREMYAADEREEFVRKNFEPLFQEALASRPVISISEADIQRELVLWKNELEREVQEFKREHRRRVLKKSLALSLICIAASSLIYFRDGILLNIPLLSKSIWDFLTFRWTTIIITENFALPINMIVILGFVIGIPLLVWLLIKTCVIFWRALRWISYIFWRGLGWSVYILGIIGMILSVIGIFTGIGLLFGLLGCLIFTGVIYLGNFMRDA